MKNCLIIIVIAGMTLSYYGLTAEDVQIGGKQLPALIKQLQSDNRGLQVRAARALSEAPSELSPPIVPKVIPLLKSERENDRFVAAQILGEYGAVAKAAAKAFGQILKDAQPSEEVDRVAEALAAKFNEEYDQYSDVRREAVRAIGMIGPSAKKVIPKLTRALTDYVQYSTEHQMVRQQAAWACGRMGPLAAEHMDRLIAMLHSERRTATRDSRGYRGRIVPVNENVLNNIVDKMEQVGGLHGWNAFKDKAFKALEGFGTKALPAKPYLMRVLREIPDNRVPIEPLIAATRVLGAIGPDAKDALELLEKMKTYQSHPHAEIPQEKHDILHKEAEMAITKIKK